MVMVTSSPVELWEASFTVLFISREKSVMMKRRLFLKKPLYQGIQPPRFKSAVKILTSIRREGLWIWPRETNLEEIIERKLQGDVGIVAFSSW